MNLPNSYTSHILSIEIQNCETEVATALTKICPFWGNGGSRHLMGVHAKKRGFTQVSRKFHAVGFLGVHTVYLKASLQCWTTLARNLTVSSIAALDVFFWYSNWILAYFCYPTDTYRFFLPLSLPIKHRSMFSVGSCLAASLWAETKTTKKSSIPKAHVQARLGFKSQSRRGILPWYLRVNRQMSTNNNLEKETRSRVATIQFAQKVVNTETYYCKMRHHDRIPHREQHTKSHTH